MRVRSDDVRLGLDMVEDEAELETVVRLGIDFAREDGEGGYRGGGGEGGFDVIEYGGDAVRVLAHELEDAESASTEVARCAGVVVRARVAGHVVHEARGDEVVLCGDGDGGEGRGRV